MPTLQNILQAEIYFNNLPRPLSKVKLSPCETIIDVEKFLDGHITLLKANYDKPFAKPYYDRLIKLKKIIENDN